MSPHDLALLCQKQLQYTKHLNYMLQQTSSDVLEKQAKISEQLYSQGTAKALEGIPIAFKDNFCTLGVPTTCGSRMLLNYVPPYNATMVEKVLEAGALMIGKANLDEFAMGSGSTDGCHGPVINPWSMVTTPSGERLSPSVADQSSDGSDWFVAGGSSGGSAAAVAAGACLASFGSDTGGSVRIPASYCGLVGLKPTYGLLSRHGLIPLVNSMDVPGIFTKTVTDSAIILNAVAGHDNKDSTTVQESHTPIQIDEDIDISKLNVGIPKEFYVPGLSEEVVTVWREIADLLEKAGARVTEVSMPHSRHCIICYHVLCCCEVASNFSRYTGIEFGLRCGSEESTEELYAENRHHGFNDVVRGRILAGNFFLLRRNYERFFLKAQRIRRLISNDFKNAFSAGVDFLLTPITLSDAPSHSWFIQKDSRTRSAEQDVVTTAANLAGVPAISLPLKLSRQNLPLSLQLMGPRFSESRLLSLAHWIENEVQFQHLDLDFHSVEESAENQFQFNDVIRK
ncbi:glutamyl-tRNA(gln) amidotransferase subunit a, mitochondrial [Plakobranchus ocellatus]|uniref:Glutamyl-tRNA(Gln) amidotransferase subunit A, mitochondrial n=1 Tax=Plakobranchus ocellatus TaxID=259542 RepID=A0AAV4AC93_9GAST|nr:glutamyl-tRNA(gln) amidotransferase subunit a, mitochondrial [Plakobranchus ocellatus]